MIEVAKLLAWISIPTWLISLVSAFGGGILAIMGQYYLEKVRRNHRIEEKKAVLAAEISAELSLILDYLFLRNKYHIYAHYFNRRYSLMNHERSKEQSDLYNDDSRKVYIDYFECKARLSRLVTEYFAIYRSSNFEKELFDEGLNTDKIFIHPKFQEVLDKSELESMLAGYLNQNLSLIRKDLALKFEKIRNQILADLQK